MGRVATTTSRDAQFRLRDIALAAYGPTVVNSLGHGAVLPVLADAFGQAVGNPTTLGLALTLADLARTRHDMLRELSGE